MSVPVESKNIEKKSYWRICSLLSGSLISISLLCFTFGFWCLSLFHICLAIIPSLQIKKKSKLFITILCLLLVVSSSYPLLIPLDEVSKLTELSSKFGKFLYFQGLGLNVSYLTFLLYILALSDFPKVEQGFIGKGLNFIECLSLLFGVHCGFAVMFFNLGNYIIASTNLIMMAMNLANILLNPSIGSLIVYSIFLILNFVGLFMFFSILNKSVLIKELNFNYISFIIIFKFFIFVVFIYILIVLIVRCFKKNESELKRLQELNKDKDTTSKLSNV